MNTRRIAIAFRLGAGLLFGLLVYRMLVVPHPPLTADEAGHALPAARMALALREGSVHGFLDATRREVVWPFMHPWVVTPFFLAFGVSAHVARLASVVAFSAALALVPFVARELALGTEADAGPHRGGSPSVMLGWLSIAVLLTATTWELVCTVMSEPLGTALTLAALGIEAHAARRGRIGGHVLCGLLAAATFFTKYSYGVPLMAAILLARAVRTHRKDLAPLLATLAGMALPVAAWLAWILGPDPRRVSELVGAFVNRDEGLHGLADLAFYFRAIVSAAGAPVAIVVAVLVTATLARGHLARKLPSLLFVGFTLLMLTLHPNKQARYLFTALPVLLVLAETELGERLRRLRGSEVLWPALAMIVLVTRNPLTEIRRTAADAQRLAPAGPILAYVEGSVAGREPVLFLGTTGLLPHLALTWEMLEREQREPAVDLLLFPGPGSGGVHRTGYPAEMGPQYGATLEKALADGRFRSVVTLELGPASPFLPDWLAKWDAFGQNYVRAMAEREETADYTLASERAFPAGDARVRIYVRRDSPPRSSDLARATGRAD
jgi:4-amino-4-deoxy-L-arabinose transferase-like glycosyltransferase